MLDPYDESPFAGTLVVLRGRFAQRSRVVRMERACRSALPRSRLRHAGSDPAAAVDLDPTTPERVDSAPAPRDVEQLEMPDHRRTSGIDDEMVAERLQAEHRPEQEQRRPRRPSLRAARGRVLDRVLRLFALIAAECLRQSAVEELRGVQDAGRDRGRLVLEARTSSGPRR